MIISSSDSDWFASNSLEILFEISAKFIFFWNGLLINYEIPSMLLNSPNLAWISLSTISISFINFLKSHLLISGFSLRNFNTYRKLRNSGRFKFYFWKMKITYSHMSSEHSWFKWCKPDSWSSQSLRSLWIPITDTPYSYFLYFF